MDSCAVIFNQSMGARNREGIGLSYRAAKLHRLAELIPWNRFLGSLKIEKFRLSPHIILPSANGVTVATCFTFVCVTGNGFAVVLHSYS
jgi:hypothetical protein